jgi:phosphate transport system substrate-binding protein
LTRKGRLRLATLMVAMVASLTMGLTAGSAYALNGVLNGAGSTLIQPLMAFWSQDWLTRAGVQVNYAAVGSGTGIAQITARAVDFGASDAPLTSAQAAACNGCTQIPWALTATGAAYNLPGVSGLHLTGPLLAAIYEGKITTWNDSRIAKINKGKALPATKITPVYRSDGSGDTYAFTDYLSRIDKTWAKTIGNSTQVSFPAGVGGKGNAGVTAVVASTQGAVGYISASYAIAHGLPIAALQNAAGKFEFPNLSNIEAAAQTVKRVPGNLELHIVNPSKKAKLAYPLSTFTYAIVASNSPANVKSLLSSFVYYAMTTGQSFGAQLDFAPIPKVVLNAAIKAAKAL